MNMEEYLRRLKEMNDRDRQRRKDQSDNERDGSSGHGNFREW
jgi:hypothetical protein